jgi:hypothetical protein
VAAEDKRSDLREVKYIALPLRQIETRVCQMTGCNPMTANEATIQQVSCFSYFTF